MSLSARRAWIEIIWQSPTCSTPCVALRKESVDRNPRPPAYQPIQSVALRKESVDRNCLDDAPHASPHPSLSARRAWIEISSACSSSSVSSVALRKESVDRNIRKSSCISRSPMVALRKESVDRNRLWGNNTAAYPGSLSARRAWIEIPPVFHTTASIMSLSARRAWIEICPKRSSAASVPGSLSARRAWIEIHREKVQRPTGQVALRKESVDRNYNAKFIAALTPCRSPQGERG